MKKVKEFLSKVKPKDALIAMVILAIALVMLFTFTCEFGYNDGFYFKIGNAPVETKVNLNVNK